MKSIAVQNLDDQRARLIRREANKKATSLHTMIKQLLGPAPGISGDRAANRQNEFADLLGTWTEEGVKAFYAATESSDELDQVIGTAEKSPGYRCLQLIFRGNRMVI